MNFPKPLEVATQTYYWKPMAALFRSLELKLYCDSGVVFQQPLLDLGCGDGKVVDMLRELKLLGKPLCGLEISAIDLMHAKTTNAHLNLIQGDANKLPFSADAFSTIVCNGVFCSIPQGVDFALKEVHRVLKKDGIIVATIPTDKFIDVLSIPKMLGALSKELSSSYKNKLNNRLPHFNTFSPEVWKERFENNGLQVINSVCFFSPRTARTWNILTMQVFRIFGFLKFLKNESGVNLVSSALKKIFLDIYTDEDPANPDRGYVFIVAQKTK